MGVLSSATASTIASIGSSKKHELTERVAPAVKDPQLATSLQMIDHILATLAVRAEHEIEWMLDEIDNISDVVGRVAASADAPPSVREALDALQTTASGSMSLSDVTTRYALASEALSRAIEATVATPGPLREQVAYPGRTARPAG